ncbi:MULTISPECIES: cache domain-containing protein [unclassified Sphingobium]|uniref:cache domain-containing protein n=1 Tax=unclassified Sphingobium TaxID=2611147 RepID=UPI000D15982C|nr:MULTISPECIES: cache domain-containing protein [unclassified Sphingobium]MBG6116493.1 cytochrome c [Sphingobium sp. JAI105]PSO10798.1 histidine kinase [Sphingobium sp. AEW4]TWD04374.1 single cache domain-containing protein [Sphingobium sp. AEW010]TWD21957.1 single cache domain-containing protein [Sphingobium sp. AEW013]TWD24527.1 single cache domain-containing protein [Sphingobium sp. AEW001]
MFPFSRTLTAMVCALALSAAPALAAPHADAAQAQAMLEKAVATIKTAGAGPAFAAFNQKDGVFNTGELYVFVFDLNGVYEAYGAHPGLVGRDVSDLTDAEGKPIVRDMIEIARTSGHGKINYVWLNRADNRVERKMSLIELVDNHVVGVGYYPE